MRAPAGAAAGRRADHELVDHRLDLLHATHGGVHLRVGDADVLGARARLGQLLRRGLLVRACRGLRDVLAARAAADELVLILRRVALRDRRLERDLGVVDVGGHGRALIAKLVEAVDVALRLVDGGLGGVQPRLRGRDVLGARAGDRFLPRRLGGLRARLRGRDLLGPRAGL